MADEERWRLRTDYLGHTWLFVPDGDDPTVAIAALAPRRFTRTGVVQTAVDEVLGAGTDHLMEESLN